MRNSSTYTALDLLFKVIEFTNMTRDSADWSFEKQKENPPRLVRLQQIHALMEAFVPELLASKDIVRGIENIYSADFIIHRPIEHYASLLEKIEKTIAESQFGTDKTRDINVYHLQHNYRDLLNYYLKLNMLLNHNNAIIEITYPYFFPYIVTSSICTSISSNASTISNLLASFIDPREQSFTEDELINQFNYPTEDLLDLDLDWM